VTLDNKDGLAMADQFEKIIDYVKKKYDWVASYWESGDHICLFHPAGHIRYHIYDIA
jgi:hypothetical protein